MSLDLWLVKIESCNELIELTQNKIEVVEKQLDLLRKSLRSFEKDKDFYVGELDKIEEWKK